MAKSTRPPIVSVLGHVDHGKTSLLDAIRHTNVQSGESGGITQHIGAYQVEHNSRIITFVDTPGHAAFSAMRARGGQVADLAVLVVAADDGVMPQTKESIDHIQKAEVPFVVAINKIDLPDADPLKAKSQLSEVGVYVEGFGGNIPVVEVSAKTGTNLDLLLETLLLMADLEEINADPQGTLEAIIIESSLDRFKGPLATVIIKNGTLTPTDNLALSSDTSKVVGKVKALIDWQGKQLTSALPSQPAQILGFNITPPVGEIVTHPGADIAAITFTSPLTDSAPVDQDVPRLKLVIKTDVAGTLEAILGALPSNVDIIAAESGPISESDILLAQSTSSQVIGFRTKLTTSAKKLAKTENVSVSEYTTIYDLLESLQLAAQAAADNQVKEFITGQAKVLKVFAVNQGKVLGSTILSGQFNLGDSIHIKHNDELIGDAKVTSLKIGRDDRTKVKKDEECGIILDSELDIVPGDVIIGFEIK